MKKKIVIIPILLCFAFANIGCGGKQRTGSTDDPQERNDTDTVAGPSVPSDTVAVKPNSATLLFDASGSMHGYLNTSDSRFVGVISSFENIPNSINIRMYGTSEGEPIESTEFDNMLSNRNINWSNESDLKAMVQSMINHVKTDDVCFLITDGILSGSNAQIKSSPDRSYNIRQREKMSNDLSAMMNGKAGKLSALIVRYNATFNGTYSCYNNDGKKLTNKERPFYVIALGKWCYIKYLEDVLKEGKEQKGISTSFEDMVMIGDNLSYKQLKLSPSKGINPKDGKLVIKQGKGNDLITLSANISCLPSYMQTEDYFKSNLELFVQHSGQSLKDLEKYELSVISEKGKPKLKIDIKSGTLVNSKLVFRLKHSLPDWIETKSDDNDLDIATNPFKLNKTFNLKFFIAGFGTLHDGKYIKEQTMEFK